MSRVRVIISREPPFPVTACINLKSEFHLSTPLVPCSLRSCSTPRQPDRAPEPMVFRDGESLLRVILVYPRVDTAVDHLVVDVER